MHWLLDLWPLWMYIGVALVWAIVDGAWGWESDIATSGPMVVWLWPLVFGWLVISAPYWVPKGLWSLSKELRQWWDKRQAINNLMEDVSKRTPK